MADRSSISSFFKSSLRGPFQRSAHQQDSEANGGTYSTHSIPTFQSHLCSPFATTCPNSLSFCTASEEKAPGFSVNIALGQSNADTSKTPYEMRRQQVRRAQKKHRQKKENYVLALEEEIQQLRRTVHTSQQHIRVLSDALSSHGVSIPDSPVALRPEFNMARVALVGSPGPNASLKVQKPDSKGYPPLAPSANGIHDPNAAMQTPDRNMLMDIDISPQHFDRDYTSPSVAVSLPVVSPSGDSATEYSGVEFVLALEHPCLHHTGHPFISMGMPGHALTLNAAALACAPEIIEPNEAWSMPTASLERLLELSNILGLRPGTLTPIQAWQHVRRHPRFAQLTSEKFQKLVELLVKEVKCQGFGAAMNEKVLDTVLHRVF